MVRARLEEAGVQPPVAETPQGVQIAVRENEDARWLFAMNFSGKPVSICLPAGMDALSERPICGETQLPVNGVVVLKMQKN